MDRRSFLRGFVAVVGYAVVAPTLDHMALPCIVGDGEHDDTTGLQAAIDGKPFSCAAEYVYAHGGRVIINGGTYRITDTLHFWGNVDGVYISGAHFNARDLASKTILNFHEGCGASSVQSCYF